MNSSGGFARAIAIKTLISARRAAASCSSNPARLSPPEYHVPIREMAKPDPKLVVRSDPEILGGTPVFAGTRVPVKTLFDYLEAGDSLEIFLDEFPSVSRAQAVGALELAREVIAPDAHPA